MKIRGKLIIVNGEARLNGWLLAKCDDDTPLADAVPFLESEGCEEGDEIEVEGNPGAIGGVTVFCIESARRVEGVALDARVAAAKRLQKPPAKKKGKSRTKKKRPSKQKVQRKRRKSKRRKAGKAR